MKPPPGIEAPKWVLQVMNHVYDIERKLVVHGDPGNIKRNVDRIKEAFEGEHIFYEDPMGQPFNETRSDLEASISGQSPEGLVVVDVIKPIVRFGSQSRSRVIQKGVVVVESKPEGR